MIQRENGFTILELLIAVTIASIIMALALPSYTDVINKRAVTSAAEQIQSFVSVARTQSVRMNEAPVIETHVINSGHDIGGAGEPGTPGIAPALANAVFDATGLRIRQLPLGNFDLNYQAEEAGVVG